MAGRLKDSLLTIPPFRADISGVAFLTDLFLLRIAGHHVAVGRSNGPLR